LRIRRKEGRKEGKKERKKGVNVTRKDRKRKEKKWRKQKVERQKKERKERETEEKFLLGQIKSRNTQTDTNRTKHNAKRI